MRLFQRRIYADWAATTPMHWRVARAMRKARGFWANPSAIHAEGVEVKKRLEGEREKVARLLSAKPDEIYFTSGGTEANCTIIQGVLRTRLEKGVRPADVHVVSTSIEHSSVLETLRLFAQHGVRVTYVAPGADGVVRADDVLAAITPQTALVTCMYVNNEIGTIQPVSKIGAGIRKIRAEKVGRVGAADAVHGVDGAHVGANFPVFHSDASQAPLWLSCDMEGLRVDALTLDAHKMQGPKGIGALSVRRHVSFEPLMAGGGQERGKRPTTESLVLISGFASALAEAQNGREKRSDKARKAQQYFLRELAKKTPAAVVNGSTEQRIPNNINISLPDLDDPEFAVIKLDHAGIACSTKSSCLKGEEESYVVKTIASADQAWRAKNTLRFTFSPEISCGQIKKILKVLGDL